MRQGNGDKGFFYCPACLAVASERRQVPNSSVKSAWVVWLFEHFIIIMVWAWGFACNFISIRPSPFIKPTLVELPACFRRGSRIIIWGVRHESDSYHRTDIQRAGKSLSYGATVVVVAGAGGPAGCGW